MGLYSFHLDGYLVFMRALSLIALFVMQETGTTQAVVVQVSSPHPTMGLNAELLRVGS